MNVKTITIGSQSDPIALSRSSLKMIKDAKQAQVESYTTKTLPNNNEARFKNFNLSKTPSLFNSPKSINLVISNQAQCDELFDEIDFKQDLYLSTLVEEYQTSLNRKDCDNTRCYRFKVLSYRIIQSLLEKIEYLKNDLQASKKNSNPSKSSSFRTPSSQSSSFSEKQFNDVFVEKDRLLNLVEEKNKRIHDLEKLLDDQKRLRVQDASQVEEKAARIKEWVANKLKELESQNKHLRDQNKRQKEVVETLSNQLATLNPITTSHRARIPNQINCLNQTSSPETIESERSLEFHQPLPKKNSKNDSSYSCNDNFGDQKELRQTKLQGLNEITREESSGFTKIEIGNSRDVLLERKSSKAKSSVLRCESPVYDSVTIEQTVRKNFKVSNPYKLQESSYPDDSNSAPPPPPLHQSDLWELQLYDLAEQTFSSLVKKKTIEPLGNEIQSQGSFESYSNSDIEVSNSRKSSYSTNDLISLVKPSFITISGDVVVDNLIEDILTNDQHSTDIVELRLNQPTSLESNEIRSVISPMHLKNLQRKPSTLHESLDKPTTPNLFDSPLRTRSGKDSILRTQSVRRNPAPERLYDFIVADLTKRGYLIKPGALKNHNRWLVLKNFHLYSYKNESEEAAKATPNLILRLGLGCQVSTISQSGESHFPFRITCSDRNWQFIADSGANRDDWIKFLNVATNLSDVEADSLTKQNATHEGLVNVTRNGHTKRCFATLINHVIFFLKSLTDPTPISYLSIKGAKVKEFTDNFDYDLEEHELLKQESRLQDCSLAIYPRYSLNLDPVYITLAGQQETDRWFYFLSSASGVDQSSGTQFEQALTRLMISNSMVSKLNSSEVVFAPNSGTGCSWKDYSVILYSERPISQPLTSLPNETLRIEAVELFKSLLLFTQVPIEPIAIEYHVSLMQNCFDRFLKYPELRNEFFAQLIKQCTYVLHRCHGQRLSSGSSGSNSNQRSSFASLSPASSECQFITDTKLLDSILQDRSVKLESISNLSHRLVNKDQTESFLEDTNPPSQSELLQVMQILAVAVSLNLPRGRMRWWLMNYLRKFATIDTNIGKYALYTFRAIERTTVNGPRENIPSRTEIMSILLRNPFDHSSPHSLPVNFSDGSYLVIETDGSTTVEEFMSTMMKTINIRHSLTSDFYLFADDPSGSKELYILEPQRKVLDVVGWWEQLFRRQNSGRYQSIKSIKLMCKKRLILKSEEDETYTERLLIVHQLSQEVASQRIPMSENLSLELTAIMAQLTHGDYEKSKDSKSIKCTLSNFIANFLSNKNSSQINNPQNPDLSSDYHNELMTRWLHLSGKSTQDCVRVYLNCIRRLKLDDEI